MTLIQRDGGTGPLKPRQQTDQHCANSRKPQALKIRRASTSRIRPLLLYRRGLFLYGWSHEYRSHTYKEGMVEHENIRCDRQKVLG